MLTSNYFHNFFPTRNRLHIKRLKICNIHCFDMIVERLGKKSLVTLVFHVSSGSVMDEEVETRNALKPFNNPAIGVLENYERNSK